MKKYYLHVLLVVAAAALVTVAYAAFFRPASVVTNEPVVETPPLVEIPPEPSQPDASATVTLEVVWSAPTMIAPVDMFSARYRGEGDDVDPQLKANYTNASNYHRVGMVRGGTYDGASVALVGVTELCGMGGIAYVYHFLLPKEGMPVLLVRHSPQFFNDSTIPPNDPCRVFDTSKYVADAAVFIPDLVLPTQLKRGASTFTLTYSSFWNAVDAQVATPLFDPKDKVLAFVDPVVGNVYRDAANATSPVHGFYVSAPDGTIRTYALDIPFYDADAHMPNVMWADGTKNTKEYWATDVGGCGMRNLVAVVSGVARTDLKAVGTTPQGESIYVLKDANHPTLKTLYEESYSLGRGDAKMSYEAFVAENPVFLWYDAFGRLIRFLRADFLPNAECGKPVIYLYPEKTTDVSVKLYPQGGFTVTEPAYDGGWNVRATPKGELTNLKDGKTHPYLFWEGRGGLYETPKRGFVVAQKDVHAFLVEKLSALGLNAQERADFIEFWEPRMTGSPWYFVTFMGNRTMDALAPLEISPKPDTVIRVLMDFLPLERPIPVEGFRIQTPKREGFTVVEWGGVIR